MTGQLYDHTAGSFLDDQNRPKNKRQTVQVIGAGFSRTGTLSFTVAVQRLLNGPMCHGGSACLSREESWIEGWISILDPKRPNTSQAYIVDTLQTLLEGYVGVSDVPCVQFVGELCEAFPDAVVICTTRDTAEWWISMEPVLKAVTPWWLPILFASRSTLRYFRQWLTVMDVRNKVNYGPEIKSDENFLAKHNEYVKRVTPPGRLHFYDVKDGWEPLCKILNVRVPDEPFPHINDNGQMKKDMDKLVMNGIMGWLQIFGLLAAIIALAFSAVKR